MTLRILVTGGAGYIGSHMCLKLLDEGHQVVVFDNFSRGHRDAVEAVTVYEGDLRNHEQILHCLESQAFDAVIHFAAYAYVGESVTNPNLYYQNNVVGSLNLLSAMKASKTHRLVFSSTCATYGDQYLDPIEETYVQDPVNPYGRSKWLVE